MRARPNRLASDRRGTVAVIGALSLSVLLGIGALSVDLGRGYSQRIVNQRTADAAALGAALAYKAAASSEAVLLPTAQDLATANGQPDAIVAAALVQDMPTSGARAVKVTVSTQVPIAIASAIGFRGSYTVSASAYATLASAPTLAPACFVALATSGVGISTSGGATIDVPECTVAAVGDIDNQGTRIAAKNIVSGSGSVTNNSGTLSASLLRYAVNFTNPSWNTSIPAADKIVKTSTTITDPLAGNADLATARQAIGTSTAPNAIGNPSTPAGADWALNWSPASNVAGYRQGYSANYVIPAGNYTIRRLTIEGGLNVTFESGSTITIANGLVDNGNKLIFGDVDLRVNGGFKTGSNGVTIGNGRLMIGSGDVSFAGTNVFGNGPVTINSALSISGGTNLTLGAGAHAFGSISVGGGSWLKMGAGDLDVRGGISIGGDSTLAAGAGNYRLGPDSSGRAIHLDGSAVMLMGDGNFSANGSIATGGGSRLVFGRTDNHQINGDMSIAGSVLFPPGRYTVAGNVTNGTGGTTWPYSSKVTGQSYGNTIDGVDVSGFDLAGINVSFIVKGTVNLAGGAKSKLLAASTGTAGGAITDLLIDSLTTGATSWAAGAQNIFTGAVHLPNSDVTMSGGSTTLSNGQCFMLIARTITASGGAAAGSACTSITGSGGSGGGADIGLVQ